jgi:hypothetical protein
VNAAYSVESDEVDFASKLVCDNDTQSTPDDCSNTVSLTQMFPTDTSTLTSSCNVSEESLLMLLQPALIRNLTIPVT